MLPFETDQWESLEPQVRTLWRISGVINAFIIAALAAIPEFLITPKLRPEYLLPTGVITGTVFVIILIAGQVFVNLTYKNYRFSLGDDDLSVAKGVLWKSWRFISRNRVQHVDITAGPIARLLGLVHVSIYVGGMQTAAVSIPGLTKSRGEDLRHKLIRDVPPEITSVPTIEAQNDDRPIWQPDIQSSVVEPPIHKPDPKEPPRE